MSTVTAFRWLLGPGVFAAGAEIRNRSMLPGFRFLFAAILLSTSILVFGLGAAALLRTTHQQYASNPGWRTGPQEPVFAQAPEPAQPVLAVLRAEPELPAETTPSLRDQVPTIALPMNEPEQVAALTTEIDVQPEVAAPLADVAAIEPANSEPAEAEPAKSEPAKAEPAEPEPTVAAAAPASTDTLTPADTTAAIPEAQAAATASEPAPADPALAAAAIDVASARLAALDAATAATDSPAKAKVESSKADSKATKRKVKAKQRNRVVRRPPPQQLQQQLDPFGQPQPAFATTTARTR